MKISVMCESLLLQDALTYYLKDMLVEFEDCEFVISDRPLQISKPICTIGSSSHSDIKKPFTQISLFENLQNFYHHKLKSTKISANIIPENFLNIKNPELKMQIDSILAEFSSKIYQTLKNNG
ncbi:hypothetical protein BKH42_01635 [Helicobacter sp. 13S00482-2]|uniref:hypothetical protein n=1 Tax=Helicobacter sp. 13S00482-2 TaxID=1476200 RepID=UPI000BA5F499|nr:hypothetical protein [Helicobacter sp. 13S00482-2]PAF54234.1 hypothetical protein BKH42_01635 [Helicobacter sp. 13S00482-2]